MQTKTDTPSGGSPTLFFLCTVFFLSWRACICYLKAANRRQVVRPMPTIGCVRRPTATTHKPGQQINRKTYKNSSISRVIVSPFAVRCFQITQKTGASPLRGTSGYAVYTGLSHIFQDTKTRFFQRECSTKPSKKPASLQEESGPEGWLASGASLSFYFCAVTDGGVMTVW